MSERERDLFLYLWHETRKSGPNVVELRGGIIGGIGGVVLAWMLVPYAVTPGVEMWDLLTPLLSALRLFFVCISACAIAGWFGAQRYYKAQDARYQPFLASGVQIPLQKPPTPPSQRWAARAIAVAVSVIAVVIVARLIMAG